MSPIVFIDTMIIIEAFRTGCWEYLSSRYDLHIVQSVFDEALAGKRERNGYILVPRNEIEEKTTVHKVTDDMLAHAYAVHAGMTTLDRGERDLLAYVHSVNDKVHLLTTADKAAIKAACALGLREQLRSFEVLVNGTKLAEPIKRGYTETALSIACTEYLLENPI